ncbi:MAG: AlpA family phage regulatory protein [Sulfuricurvum sp.]|nr:AlpA family phage regulatory protein [Sulfuricurvum sp.]
MDQNKIEKLQNVKDVAGTLDIGVSTVWLMVKEYRFPAPIKISQGATRWKQSDVQAFINGTWNG